MGWLECITERRLPPVRDGPGVSTRLARSTRHVRRVHDRFDRVDTRRRCPWRLMRRGGLGGGVQTMSATAISGDLLTDPRRLLADLRLVARAVRQRWPVPAELRETLPDRLAQIVLQVTPDGQYTHATRARVMATRILDEMSRQNVEADGGTA